MVGKVVNLRPLIETTSKEGNGIARTKERFLSFFLLVALSPFSSPPLSLCVLRLPVSSQREEGAYGYAREAKRIRRAPVAGVRTI